MWLWTIAIPFGKNVAALHEASRFSSDADGFNTRENYKGRRLHLERKVFKK